MIGQVGRGGLAGQRMMGWRIGEVVLDVPIGHFISVAEIAEKTMPVSAVGAARHNDWVARLERHLNTNQNMFSDPVYPSWVVAVRFPEGPLGVMHIWSPDELAHRAGME